MAYKTYTRKDLADFTGRPEASFPQAYMGTSAIPQAVLLFKLATCIADPSLLTADQQQLVDFAIISMADAIFLDSQYATVKAAPFSSETIGSYSYSKAAQAIQAGQQTGVMWFDMAVSELSVCDSGSFQQGGIEVYEDGGSFRDGNVSGNIHFLSPGDIDSSRSFGYDPSR